MVTIELIYRKNKTGEHILQLINNNFTPVTSQIIDIEEKDYINIQLMSEASIFKREINPPSAQINCIHRHNMREIMMLNGLPCIGSRESTAKYYDLLLFGLQIMSIKQRNIAEAKNSIKYINENEVPIAVNIARRAVYHLGLDFALVRIALTGQRQHKVVSVDPSPVNIRERDLTRLINRLQAIYKGTGIGTDKEPKLGADPEFMMLHAKTGRMIAASRFFPHHGRVGYDNISIPRLGQHPVAELRPQPSVSPLILADNLKGALVRASKMAPYQNIKWVAGSQPYRGFSIGGHIHFSNVKLNFPLLRALDNYLAIPVYLIENPRSAVRRRRRYGILGNYRIKNYGGFEYRTLGSWLVSPQITKGVLCLAKVVVNHYPELNKNYLAGVGAQKAFYRGNQDYFKPIFAELWAEIVQTASYEQYAEELRQIYEMISNGQCWDEQRDLRETWDMKPYFRRTYIIR